MTTALRGRRLLTAVPALLASWELKSCVGNDRVFLHVWSVNLKFLPEGVFQSKGLAASLLAAHLALLWLFAQNRWCRREGGVLQVVRDFWKRSMSWVSHHHTGHVASCCALCELSEPSSARFTRIPVRRVEQYDPSRCQSARLELQVGFRACPVPAGSQKAGRVAAAA